MGSEIERRRGKRAFIQAPLVIRRFGSREPTPLREEVTTNVSLAGVYFETEDEHPYSANEFYTASIAIPESETRDFPFRRLAGRGRVVRIEELSGTGQAGRKRFGIALEFGQDLTALTAIPARG